MLFCTIFRLDSTVLKQHNSCCQFLCDPQAPSDAAQLATLWFLALLWGENLFICRNCCYIRAVTTSDHYVLSLIMDILESM